MTQALTERAGQRPTAADAERALLDLPQIPIDFVHHFAPGVYVREMVAPADSFIVGHEHREAGINIMLSGRALVVADDGEPKELVAPVVLMGQAGTRKMAYVMEEMRWLNIHPNADDETNLEVLEARYIVKSEAFLEHELNRLRDAAVKTLAAKEKESVSCRG